MKTMKQNAIQRSRYYFELEYMRKFTTINNLIDVLGNGSCLIFSLLLFHEDISQMFYEYYSKHASKFNREEEATLLHNISYYFRQFLVFNISKLKEKELKNLYEKSEIKNKTNIHYGSWKNIFLKDVKCTKLIFKKSIFFYRYYY